MLAFPFRFARLPLAAAALVALLGSCAPSQPFVQVPTLQVEQARLTGLTLASPAVAHVTLRLRVDNPNAVGLNLANIQGRFILNGSDVGAVSLPNVALAARGSAEQTALLDLPVSLETAGVWLKVARGQQMPYRVDGRFTADMGLLGQHTFGPYTLAQGLFQQPALLP